MRDKDWLPSSGSCFFAFEADQCPGCLYADECPFPDMGRLHEAGPECFPHPPWRYGKKPYCAMRVNKETQILELRKG